MATQVPRGTGVPARHSWCAVAVRGWGPIRWVLPSPRSIPVRHLWAGERPRRNLPQTCCLLRGRVLFPRTLVRRYS